MKRLPDSEHWGECRRCHKPLWSPSPARRRVFCSIECKAKAERSRPRNDPRPCVVCGNIFNPARHRGNARFCSKVCVWQSIHAERTRTQGRRFAEKIGNTQRNRGDGKSYRKLHGKHEHRIVAERKLGRRLKPSEVVHHIDGNIRNNTPENLEIITQAEHMQRHGLGIPGKTPWWKPWLFRRSYA